MTNFIKINVKCNESFCLIIERNVCIWMLMFIVYVYMYQFHLFLYCFMLSDSEELWTTEGYMIWSEPVPGLRRRCWNWCELDYFCDEFFVLLKCWVYLLSFGPIFGHSRFGRWRIKTPFISSLIISPLIHPTKDSLHKV